MTNLVDEKRGSLFQKVPLYTDLRGGALESGRDMLPWQLDQGIRRAYIAMLVWLLQGLH